ncbi:MAG: methyltransferase domain-containing protein [Deltaproteobacteria bacterium]|nr:methyltransferase domain-containing protein [Deltaproteobacteria bacterium]
MPSEIERTQKYFDRIPEQWHARYRNSSHLRSILSRFWRSALYERHRLTFERCGTIAGATVLDIGCGSGEYSLEFASKGAIQVIGVDIAPAMVEFSQRLARERGLSQRCRFVCGDFLDHPFADRFDIVIAMGLFDYVANPSPFLKKIARLTRGRFLASYPCNEGIWAFQRTIRYRWLKRVPIFDYTPDRLTVLYGDAGFDSLHMLEMKRGIFAIACKELTPTSRQ